MNEGVEIQTMPELVKHIIDHWKSEQIKALKEEESQKQKLTVEIQKEQNLIAELKKARLIAAQMEADFLEIEARTEGEKRAMIETAAIREQDVKSGKATLAEFLKKGKTEKQIYEKSVEQTMKDLETGLTAARSKNLEILEFEKELLETQTRIRYLIIEPGRALQRSLKDLAQFAEREIGFFLEEVHTSKTALEEVKSKILLTEGKSLGPGHSWSRLTVEQAYGLQFDPILPLSCIGTLKTKLQSYKSGDVLNVTYFLRTKTIDVTSISFGDKK